MILTVLRWFSAASFLFISLVARVHALPFDQTVTCGETEICLLQSHQLPEINCDCSPSIQCSWSGFADREEILSNGTTESILMWQRTGYGQYICVRDSLTVARNIMILPQTQGQSCDTCISTRACMTATKIYLNFTLLFDKSLIDGQLCELLLNGKNLTDNINITEQSCVELSSYSNYSIRCPLCPQAGRDVYHVIPNSTIANFEDCSGICNIITPTSSTAASSTATSIESPSVLAATTLASVLTTSKSTVITPTIPSTSVLETTTIPTASPISDNSNDSGSNIGDIIGGVVGGIIGVILLVIIVVLVCCIITKLCERNSMQCTPEPPTGTYKQKDVATTNFTSEGMNRPKDGNVTATETTAGMDKANDVTVTSKVTPETVAGRDKPNDVANKATPQTAAGMNKSNDVMNKATSETAAGMDKPNDFTSKVTPETAGMDKPNDVTSKTTPETAAGPGMDKPNNVTSKATLESAAGMDKPNDFTSKVTLETVAGMDKPNDVTSKTTPETAAGMDKPNDFTSKTTPETAAGMDKPNDFTSKVTLETVAGMDKPNDFTSKVTLETVAGMDKPNDVTSKTTPETVAGMDKPNDVTSKTTPETAAGMDKPGDNNSNQQSEIKGNAPIGKVTIRMCNMSTNVDNYEVKLTISAAPLDHTPVPPIENLALQVGQPIANQTIYCTQPNQQSKITGDDSSAIDSIVSQLLACDPSQLKDAIPRLHVTIKKHINFEYLIPFLNKYGIFTWDEMKYFMKKYHSDSDKVSNLIDWLPTKRGRGIHNFVRALKEAEEHDGHLEIIKDLHLFVYTVGTTV